MHFLQKTLFHSQWTKHNKQRTNSVGFQPTDYKQNAVYNNWLLKLHLAVMLQNWQKSIFHNIEWNMQIRNPRENLKSLIGHNIYFFMKKKSFNVQFCYDTI